MTEHNGERRRDLLLIALPLSVLAVLISLVVAGAVYLELRQRTDENRHLVERTQTLAEDVQTVLAAREAAQRAADQQQLDSCYQRNATGPALRRLLEAIKPAIGGDLEALAIIDSYIEQMRQNTPTRSECNALADKLELPRQAGP